jgi:AraC-like DNA-binding protein
MTRTPELRDQAYDPIPDGVARGTDAVRYTVTKPPLDLSSVVHCYWELKTERTLDQPFELHAVPDACVNLLFNQLETAVAGITALRTQHLVLPLGVSFHYVGVQFLPGVWRGRPDEIAYEYVGTAYRGALPLVQVSRELAEHSFPEKLPILSSLVRKLLADELVNPNVVAQRILGRLDEIRSVGDMACVACLSPRQLQRAIRQSTGMSPHDLLKILRLQQSFKRHFLDLYADQSHYIHSFRKITGYTPAKFNEKFDV